MPSVPELQQTQPYLAEAEGFRTMARLHGVPTGTPECITSLPLRLAQDWRLRGNFVELLRELQRKDPDFSLPDALTVLLLAVGDPGVAPGRSHLIDESIDLTAGFLASIGGWPGPDEEPVTDLDHPSDAALRPSPTYTAETPHEPADEPADEPAQQAAEDEPQLSADEEPGLDTERAKPEPFAGISLAEITQALGRLERSSVDLRLHLDSIDQRLSRMEPLLETPPPPLTQTPPPVHSRTTPQPAEVVARPDPIPPPVRAAAAAPSSELESASALTPQRDLVHRQDIQPTIPPTPSPAHHNDPSAQRQEGSLASMNPATSRPLAPRRDRFAAAMELPGTRAALNFPAREPAPPLPSEHVSDQPSSLESLPTLTVPDLSIVSRSLETLASSPHPVSLPEVDEAPAPSLAPLSIPTSSLYPAPPLDPEPTPAPAPLAGPVAPSRIAPTAATAPTEKHAPTSTPNPAINRPPASPISQDSSRPTPPDPSFTFGGIVAADNPASTTQSDAERTSRGPLLLGLFAALLIALAAFLLLRGRPLSFLLDHPKSAVSDPLSEPAAPQSKSPTPARAGQPRATPATAQPGRSSGSSRTAFASPTVGPAPTDRALSARQTTQPAGREQILEAPTFVPEAVMKAHLLSAPAPLYPRLANAVGLEGGIIFEAIIAKDGSVEGLTPLGGQRLLRDAAANAVRQWRYQPFLLHGEPVEVRSIVHVNVAPPASGEATDNQ